MHDCFLIPSLYTCRTTVITWSLLLMLTPLRLDLHTSWLTMGRLVPTGYSYIVIYIQQRFSCNESVSVMDLFICSQAA